MPVENPQRPAEPLPGVLEAVVILREIDTEAFLSKASRGLTPAERAQFLEALRQSIAPGEAWPVCGFQLYSVGCSLKEGHAGDHYARVFIGVAALAKIRGETPDAS